MWSHTIVQLGSTLLFSVLLWRLLPFVLVASASESRGTRVALLLAYSALLGVGLATGAYAPATVFVFVSALSFLTLAAAAVWALSLLAQVRRRPVGVLLVGTCALFLGLPAVVLPAPVLVFAVPLGFDLSMAAVSYLKDAPSGRDERSLRACLFFLLVDPTITFPERSQLAAGRPSIRRALARIALGVAAITAHALALASLDTLLTWPGVIGAVARGQGPVAEVAYYALRLLVSYAIHSGVASVQIGSMALLGYRTPERYQYPLLARSPVDFWNRWNRYVGGWGRRYLFMPVAFALQRRWRSSPLRSVAPRLVAVLWTFALIGVLHDANNVALHGRLTLGATLMFLLFAAGLLAWVGVARVVGPRLQASPPRYLAWFPRLAMVGVLLLSMRLAVPSMSVDGFAATEGALTWLWEAVSR